MSHWTQATHDQLLGEQPSTSLLYLWCQDHDFSVVYTIPDHDITPEERRILTDCQGLMMNEDENDEHPQVAKLTYLLCEKDRWEEHARPFSECGVFSGRVTAIYHFSNAPW